MGAAEIVLALAILCVIVLLAYYLWLKKPKEKGTGDLTRIDSYISDKGGIKVRSEPRGRAVGTVIGSDYWCSFFLPQNVSVGADKMWKTMERLAAYVSKKNIPNVLDFEYMYMPIANIKTDDGVDVFPFSGYYVRIKIDDPEMAGPVLDSIVLAVQEEAERERLVGIVPSFVPMSIYAEHVLLRRPVARRVELPSEQEFAEVQPGTLSAEVVQRMIEDAKRREKERQTAEGRT